MEKEYSSKKAGRMIFILFFIQIIVGFIGSRMPILNYPQNSWIRRDLTIWFIYEYPPVRMLDFMIGCNVGYCFLVYKSGKNSEGLYTILELVTIALVVIANICYMLMCPEEMNEEPHPERWWTYTILFSTSSCFLIWMFARSQGLISKYMVNRVTLYLGNISQYTFLIHTVVIRYVGVICNLALGSRFYVYHGRWMILCMDFLLTLVATQVWIRIVYKNSFK